MEPSPAVSSSPDNDKSFDFEFFKVFLPSFSSHKLRIPPDFVKRINVSLPNNATLEDHIGHSWSVQLVESGGKMFIKKGWEEFAAYHLLGFGDFLVFSYEHSSSTFHVKIFGKNGCKKEMAACCASEPSVGIKTAKKERVEEWDAETSTARRSNRPVRNCKRKFANLDINILHSPSACKFSSFEDILRRSEKSYIPKHPHFVSCITSSTSQVMGIPRTFLDDHRIKLASTVKLRDQNGKLWHSQITFTTQGWTGFSSGWKDFCSKNLKSNDQCVFEFVLSEGNTCNEVIVQSLHPGVQIKEFGFYRVVKV